MLQKKPKPVFWKFVKGSAKTLFAIEAILFAVSYGGWYRMNTNRDFRQYMKETFPSILEGYYQIGEILGDNRTRETDLTFWTKNLENKSD